MVWENLLIAIAALLSLTFVVGGVVAMLAQLRHSNDESQKLVQKRLTLEAHAAQRPADAKLAWDLASVTLEQYFSRNMQQVRLIFVLSLAVLFAGFGFVLFGVVDALYNPQNHLETIVAAAAGVLTQFIGATFMVVYRSTMDQAAGFSRILERINVVGMAMQIADSIPPSDPLYAQTRSEIARLLVGGVQYGVQAPFAPRTTETSVEK